MRLLLIEDERELANALTAGLAKHGIVADHTMYLTHAQELVLQNDYDAILLDRRLPDGEGLTFIPKLRRAGNSTPIIVLTARNEPMERVEGLDFGADDYLGKPFLIEELMARVRALMRRNPDDLFRHKLLGLGFLGLGTGDVVFKPAAAGSEPFIIENVWRSTEKQRRVERLLTLSGGSGEA